ncbi:MAG: DUF3450 family protein [Verrucomicrobiae bacterium]|nr:DUF3450 family protein [Verrucomicrobiae bacterium]
MRIMVILMGVLAFPAGAFAAAEGTLAGARQWVTEWVRTQELLSRTRTEWERDSELLRQTAGLYERELRSIEERLGGFTTNTTQIDRDLAEARAELELGEKALGVARDRVGRYEARLREWAPRLPAPLRSQIDPLVRRIPAEAAASGRAGVMERLQNVVGILHEIDKFNAAVTVVSEVQRRPEGAEVQVETVYLGLGQAWFTDRSGRYSGVGRPGPDGWVWEVRPEVGPAVRRAIAMYRDEAPPTFVGLPVQLP